MSAFTDAVDAIQAAHPNKMSPEATALLDAAKLHQRISELEQERDAWKEVAEKLAEELSSMKCQYGCACGHPACRVCGDTRCAAEALAAFDKLKGERK